MGRPPANRKKSDPRASKRDSLDFRDWIYEPALLPLKEESFPRNRWIHLLDQGEEGACTGFGLAAVINYLIRARGGARAERVSARMLYEMAKRHDRWPGESDDGSSARGAMKGWYKNGVCLDRHWPYEVGAAGELTPEARDAAIRYPLGAFYRVLPRRVDLHAALNEVQVIFATAATHKGWDEPRDGMIPHEPGWKEEGGHAFAIVGYTAEGFLVQNSWGKDWGGLHYEDGASYPGCAIWQYRDFDRNLWDAWVARLARPFESVEALEGSTTRRQEYASGGPPVEKAPPRARIRDHFIHIDDGGFDPRGDYYSTRGESEELVRRAVRGGARNIVFYAHGGLNSVKACARRADRWRPVFRDNGVHEIHLIWETGLRAELRDILLGKQNFVESRAGGIGSWWDRWIERMTGPLGRGLWREMREDAALAFESPANAGSIVLETLRNEVLALPRPQRPRLHLVAHSAGSILFGHLLESWGQSAVPFENLILMAPACSCEFFNRTLGPALASFAVGSLTHFHLDDDSERDDTVASVYRKSLLYLVSRSYEKKGQVVPIMGMARYLEKLEQSGLESRIRHLNPVDHPDWTTSRSHGGFDNDECTMNRVLELILDGPPNRRFTSAELTGY